MAEEKPQSSEMENTEGTKNVKMIGNSNHMDANHIGTVCRIYKAALSRSHGEEKGTLAKIGKIRFNRSTIKCLNCGRQYSGETVVTILNRQLKCSEEKAGVWRRDERSK